MLRRVFFLGRGGGLASIFDHFTTIFEFNNFCSEM